MGTARNISWSWSRQSLLQKCPRAFFYTYFPWGEPDEHIAVFLKETKTIPLLIGDISHVFVALCLRHYHRSGTLKEDLIPHALRRYDSELRLSERTAESVRKGKRPGMKVSVLSHHLDSGPCETIEKAGREALEETLQAFFKSEALAFLKQSNRKEWWPITGDVEELPHIVAQASMGFPTSVERLRIYTPYDVALRYEGLNYIIDWKTGDRKAPTVAEGFRQLAAYSIAISAGESNDVAVQPFFLRQGEKWEPRIVTPEAVTDAIAGIAAHHEREVSLLGRITVFTEKGHPAGVWSACKERFLPKARKGICAQCNFRFICEEGKKALGEGDLSSLEVARGY